VITPAARHLAHLVVAGVGDQEPAVGGHRHPDGHVEPGVGGRAVVAGVAKGASPRDTSDHPRRRHLAHLPGSWAEFEAVTLDSNAGTAASAWGQGVLGSRVLALGVPACAMNTSWSTEASGANDAHWTALGKNLVAAGLGNAVVRIGREFNGSWYPNGIQPVRDGVAADGRPGLRRTHRQRGHASQRRRAARDA